jgi:DUF971 family protein
MSHEGIRMVPEDEARRQQEQPLPKIAVTPEKVRVLLTEGKGMEIDWADGHRSAWSFAWLREACPCATCLEERKATGRKPGEPKPKPAELLPMFVPAAKPQSAEPVGRYAIQFHWLDGHAGGIYSWEYLRRSCQCQECRFAAEAAGQTVN